MTATISHDADGVWRIYIVTGRETKMTREVPSKEVGMAMLADSGWEVDQTGVLWTLPASVRNEDCFMACSVTDTGVGATQHAVELLYRELNELGFQLFYSVNQLASNSRWWYFKYYAVGISSVVTAVRFDPVLDLCAGGLVVYGVGYYQTDVLAGIKALEFFNRQKEMYGPDLYAAALCARILRSVHRATERQERYLGADDTD